LLVLLDAVVHPVGGKVVFEKSSVSGRLTCPVIIAKQPKMTNNSVNAFLI